MVTIASGTTPPDESTTVPEIEEEFPVCAFETAAKTARKRHTYKARRIL
jgi:hypothetical protein